MGNNKDYVENYSNVNIVADDYDDDDWDDWDQPSAAMRNAVGEDAQAVKVPHTNLVLLEFYQFKLVECDHRLSSPSPTFILICEQYRRGYHRLPERTEKKIDLNGHELHSDYRKIPNYCLQYHPVEQEIRDCTSTPE